MKNTRRFRPRSRAGFAMLEVIVAMTIFAVAVVALGRATMSAIEAETIMSEAEHVRRAVEAQAEVVLASTSPPQNEKLSLEDAYAGIEIAQTVDNFSPTDDENITTGPIYKVEIVGQQTTMPEGATYRLIVYVRR